MKVSELLELLEDVDGDAEVRLAFQPSWPLQYRIGEVVEVDLGADTEDCTCEGDGCRLCEGTGTITTKVSDSPPVVYIGEAGQIYDAPYLPSEASSALGWR